MNSSSFNWYDEIKRIGYDFVKKASFSSQELIRSKHDQSIVERTLPSAILLLGLVSRNLTTLG